MASNLSLSDISGEIENTLSKDALNEGDISRLKAARRWFVAKRAEIKPWSEFFNTRKFSKPKNAGEVSKRIIGNIKLYQANYVAVCILLAIYCIITSPLLLFGLSMSLGGCYYISTRGQGHTIKILGRELSVTEQYGLVFLISLPLFFLASAGSTVFWIIGASIFVIMVHASFLATNQSIDNLEAEVQLEGVQVM